MASATGGKTQEFFAADFSKPEPKKAEERFLVAYTVEHMDLNLIEELITLAFPDDRKMRMVSDFNKRFYLMGTESQHEKVQSLLKEFDKQDPAEVMTVVFHLQFVAANEAVQVVGQIARDLRVAADERTNSLIVNGTKESVQLVEELLRRLDRGEAQPEEKKPDDQSYRVMLYWLTETDKAADDINEPSNEVSDVVEELKFRDFGTLEQMGMNEVVVRSGGQFRVFGHVPGGAMNVQGELSPMDDGQFQLDFDFDVSRFKEVASGRGQRMDQAAQISTEIVTKLGHNVVLGIVGADPEDPGVRNVIVVRIEK